MSKVQVFVTDITSYGKQYIGVVDGEIRRLHFSSGDGWAVNEDIVPTMMRDFGLLPELHLDHINIEYADKLRKLNTEYEQYREKNDHIPMNDWLDLIAKEEE